MSIYIVDRPTMCTINLSLADGDAHAPYQPLSKPGGLPNHGSARAGGKVSRRRRAISALAPPM